MVVFHYISILLHVLVNIDHVDESIFDWSDHERSHSYYDMTRDAEQLMPKGNEDICHKAFGQIRHWPPNSSAGKGEGSTKSALRRNKAPGPRASVSWSSKVTCKTFSKDDPNNYNFFNANASTSEGMNFRGRPDPLYDPHAQNEARVLNDDHAQQQQQQQQHQQQQHYQDQPPPSYFDQYHNTGVDIANQPTDFMYGESQQQDVNQQQQSSSDVFEQEQTNAWGEAGSYESGNSSYISNGSSESTGSFSQQQQNEDGDVAYNEEDYGSSAGESFSTAGSSQEGGLPSVS